MLVGLLIISICMYVFSFMHLRENFEKVYAILSLFMIGYILFSNSISPWLPETLPPVGCGVSRFFQSIFTCLCGKYIPIIVHERGHIIYMTMFSAICSFLGFLTVEWLVVETKEKSPIQIEKEYKKFYYKFIK